MTGIESGDASASGDAMNMTSGPIVLADLERRADELGDGVGGGSPTLCRGGSRRTKSDAQEDGDYRRRPEGEL